ncbi:MAG: ribonuclease D [Thermoleophilia bacterium]
MSDLAGNSAVAAIADLAGSCGRLGIDTEFMGEGRYRTLLCLVQVAAPTPDGDIRIEVIDPLDDAVDPSPLAALLADPAVEIVMHAGRQDVALLRRVWQTEITNLFDTQLAAGFAGLRAQLGYEPLLHELLGVRLKKSASFTRWDARPLSAEQIDYARDDVRHILQAAAELQERLRARGRLDWAREECVALAGATDERDPDNIFSRLPRINSLDPKLRAIARELVVWREQIAEAQDRPIPSVLSDAGLVEVAKRRPSEMRQLEQIRGINESTIRRRGRAILEAVERGRTRPPIPVARRSPMRSTRPSSRSPRRSCAPARSRRSWRTS